MTYNSVDNKTVREDSGLQGFEAFFGRGNIPTPFTTLTTGGGQVNGEPDGLDVNPGGNVGDEASIFGPLNTSAHRLYGSDTRFKYSVIFHMASGGVYDDYISVGAGFNDESGNVRGACIDLKREVLISESGSAAVTTGFNSEDIAKIDIEFDPKSANTIIEFRHNGSVQREVFDGTPFGYRVTGPVRAVSDGNSDVVSIKYAKVQYEFVEP